MGASWTPRPTPSGLQSAEEWSTVTEFARSFLRAFHNSSAASSLGPGWLPEERGPGELEMEVNSGTEMDSGPACCCSVAQSCPTLCNPEDCCMPGFPVHHQLPELAPESMMPSNHLILCHPLLLLPSIFPSIRVFSSESDLCIRWPKYWSFSFSISSSNEYSGLISFRIDWFDLLAIQGT